MPKRHVGLLALTTATDVRPPEKCAEDDGGAGHGVHAAQRILHGLWQEALVKGGDDECDGRGHENA